MAVFWVLRRWVTNMVIAKQYTKTDDVTNMVIAKQYTKTDDARIGWPGNMTWILI